MASDVVTTTFGGDDSAFQNAAKRVRAGMAGIAAEAHVASGAVEGLAGVFEKLAPVLGPIIGVATAFEALRKSISQAGERELAGMQFENVAGGAAKAAASVEKLEEFGRKAGLDFPELARGTKRLMEAGMSADAAADAEIRLQKIHLNTGASAEEMGDIFARVMLKEEVSMKDLNKLAAAGIPGIADLAKGFKSLELAIKDSDTAVDRQLVLLKRQYEQIRLNTGAVNSFGQSTGLMAEAFQQFRESGSRSAMGARVTEFAGVTQGIQALSETFGEQFLQGLEQISKETGISENNLREFIDAGKIGYADLISASQRYNEEQQKIAEQKGEDVKFQNQQTLIQAQRDLVGQVTDALKAATDPGGPYDNISKYLDTFVGKMAVVKHDADETFEAFGKPLTDAFKPGLDTIHNEWAPALQKLAEEFGRNLVKEANNFWTEITKGVDTNAQKIAEHLNDALGKVATNFGTALLNEVLSGLDPRNWFSGVKTTPTETPAWQVYPESGPTTTTPQVTPSEDPWHVYSDATQQQTSSLSELLKTGNQLADTLNKNLAAVLQVA